MRAQVLKLPTTYLNRRRAPVVEGSLLGIKPSRTDDAEEQLAACLQCLEDGQLHP